MAPYVWKEPIGGRVDLIAESVYFKSAWYLSFVADYYED